MLAERAHPQPQGNSPLSHVGEVLFSAARGLQRRVVLFTADVRTLVSHQQHLGEQMATKQNNGGLSETPVQPDIQVIPPVGTEDNAAPLDNKVSQQTGSKDEIPQSLAEYLEEVL